MKNILNTSIFLAMFNILFLSQIPYVLAQISRPAVVFAPPSNIRETPNGRIICSVTNVTTINVYGNVDNGWFPTDFCGSWGYIHQSQIKVQGEYKVYCLVTNIRTGQLALRRSPGGTSIAGLNNDNVVRFIRGKMPWYYVRVFQGPNSRVNGLEGWVNANYLECAWD